MLQILHNPRCGKSRTCLAFLDDAKEEIEIINYLQNPLSEADLKSLINKLAISPLELVRQKESIWIENYKGKNLSDEEIIRAMAEHPILMERPIVIKGNRAIIGRDIEKLGEFI